MHENKLLKAKRMNKKLLKKKIEETIVDLKKEIERLIEETKPISPENSLGRITRMDAINNKSVAEAALRQAKFKLGKLNVALTKIDQDDFGACDRCKKPIRMARLMYMPESSRCVNCADRY